jgi:hypothetical protein
LDRATSRQPLLDHQRAARGHRAGLHQGPLSRFDCLGSVGTPGFARLSSNANWTFVSDARLKTDVTTAEGNLAAAVKLRPVNFRWRGDGTEDFGLIAREAREVLPRLVIGDESKDSLTLNYSPLSVVAIGAIQEQQREIDGLRSENADLKARLEKLERLLAK